MLHLILFLENYIRSNIFILLSVYTLTAIYNNSTKIFTLLGDALQVGTNRASDIDRKLSPCLAPDVAANRWQCIGIGPRYPGPSYPSISRSNSTWPYPISSITLGSSGTCLHSLRPPLRPSTPSALDSRLAPCCAFGPQMSTPRFSWCVRVLTMGRLGIVEDGLERRAGARC